MRAGLIAALLTTAALGGCATAQRMEHQSMSHEEMMQHCQMMEQHHAQGEAGAAHDPAQHGGMSHEEMMRHCAEMREQHHSEEPPASHQH